MQLCYAFWCVLLGGWSLRVECFGSKGMQTLSWALPLGCVLWSLWIVFNTGQWHYCCFVRLSRPLGNACQLSFKSIPLFCFAVFSFAVDPPTVGGKKKKDFCIRLLLAKRCNGEFKSFSKFEIIFTLAPVRISDNCCWYLVQGGRFFSTPYGLVQIYQLPVVLHGTWSTFCWVMVCLQICCVQGMLAGTHSCLSPAHPTLVDVLICSIFCYCISTVFSMNFCIPISLAPWALLGWRSAPCAMCSVKSPVSQLWISANVSH